MDQDDIRTEEAVETPTETPQVESEVAGGESA